MKSVSSMAVIAVLFFSVGCSQNFESITSGNEKASGLNCCDNNPDKPLFDMTGDVDAGIFGAHKVVDLDEDKKMVILMVPLPDNPFGLEAEGDIPEIEGAKWSIAQDMDGKWHVALHVPVEYILRGNHFFPPEGLPNGDPIPGIPGGEMPRLGLHIVNDNLDVWLYLGIEAIGAFVPTPGFNPYLKMTFPIKNRTKRKVIGYFSSVPEKDPYDGGFFLSVVLPPELSRIIDDL